MLKCLKKPVLCFTLLGMTALPAVSYATNGYFLIGFGAKSRGMGGTGTAYAQDGLAAAFNPAGMLDVGTRFDIGGDLFIPPRAVHHESAQLGDTDVQSNNNLFLIPNMGGTYQWKEDIALGFAVIGAGADTEYSQIVPPGQTSVLFNFNGIAGPEAGVRLMQMQILPSIAYRINKQHSVGFTLTMALQAFKAEGLQAFGPTSSGGLGFTSDPNAPITNNGTDYSNGAGFRLGWLGKFMNNKLSIGANYSSKVWMTKFDSYRGLFAQGGRFDIPEHYTVGFSYEISDKSNIVVEAQKIRYSGVPSIANPGPDVVDINNFFVLCPGADKDPCKLGGPLGMGFGWKDVNVFKIGYAYQYNDRMSFRAGYNHGNTPIPNDQILFNFLAPVTVEDHITFGISYKYSEDIELNGSFVYAFYNEIDGPTAFGPSANNPVDGTNATIGMEQYSFGGSIGIKW